MEEGRASDSHSVETAFPFLNYPREISFTVVEKFPCPPTARPHERTSINGFVLAGTYVSKAWLQKIRAGQKGEERGACHFFRPLSCRREERVRATRLKANAIPDIRFPARPLFRIDGSFFSRSSPRRFADCPLHGFARELSLSCNHPPRKRFFCVSTAPGKTGTKKGKFRFVRAGATKGSSHANFLMFLRGGRRRQRVSRRGGRKLSSRLLVKRGRGKEIVRFSDCRDWWISCL